jgi:glycosyltransferase involved in cell wall biosynthesis
MKITLLTAYYYPEITAATHLLSDLAEDFAEYGAEVTVVTTIPTRGLDEDTKEVYLNRRDEIIKPNLRVIRVGTGAKEGKSFVARALRYGLNVLSIYRTAKKTKTDVFLISSTPPFLGIAGAFLSKKVSTVYNLQDVFPDSLINAGKAKEESIIVRVFRKVEKYIYKKQSHIITISRDFKELLLNRGTNENKISVVYNWIDEAQVVDIPKEENVLFERYGLDKNKFYVTYCGNLGHSQNLEMIIDIAKEIENSFPVIKFVFVGDGAWKSNIEEYIKEVSSKNVTLLPFQPYKDISHVMSLGDVSLVCSKANIGKSSFPSKTWSIMSASRPVICSFDVESELCEIIRVADCGINVPPDDKEALKEAIVYAYQHPEEMRQLGRKGRRYIEGNLTRKAATRQYYNLLSKIMNENI